MSESLAPNRNPRIDPLVAQPPDHHAEDERLALSKIDVRIKDLDFTYKARTLQGKRCIEPTCRHAINDTFIFSESGVNGFSHPFQLSHCPLAQISCVIARTRSSASTFDEFC